MNYLVLFSPVVLFLVIVYLSYFAVWLGFKIFKIEGFTRSKIFGFVILSFVSGYFLKFVPRNLLSFLSPNPLFVLFFGFIASFLVLIVLLRYYFRLSGKQFWQMLVYLSAVGLFFSLALSAFTTGFFGLAD